MKKLREILGEAAPGRVPENRLPKPSKGAKDIGDTASDFARGAYNSATMDLGKYARAGVDYGVKNLGAAVGIGKGTTYGKELEQEKQKDTIAQTRSPDAYKYGGYAADAAALATGVGGLTKVGVKVGGDILAKQAAKKFSSDTHSIIDGLNRSKNAIMNKQRNIHAVEIDKSKLTPLSPERAKELDTLSAEARKKGDYFTYSSFGNEKARYSVQDALELAKTQKPKKISTKGFVDDQVGKWWQGNLERAKKAVPGKDKPIIIMKND